MAAQSPSLSLSDIMHPLSPPSVTIQPKNSPPPLRARSITPEPLELAEIEDMRRKVLAMCSGNSSKGKDKIGAREQELVDMLLRLTHPASLPQPLQLHAQAETISHLIQQREFLAQRSMEERERWDSEREGWARAAQALIIQGRLESSARVDKDDVMAAQYVPITSDPSAQRIQEFERANTALQNDKKVLQQKLAATQRRLASLESEVAQLKPLLLMQPFTLTHSHPTGTARGWSAVLPSTPGGVTSRREKDRHVQDGDLDVDDERESDDDVSLQPSLQLRSQLRNPVLRPATHEGQLLLPTSPGSPFKHRGDYYRHREPPSPSAYLLSAQFAKPVRRRAGQSAVGKTLLSDARTEHLLLAARKIGRQRASILSGVFAHMRQPEPASSQKQKSTPMTQPKAQLQPPRTPRRSANANTPLLTRTPLGQTPGQQPRTPLQSLLSAAQSVLSVPGSTSPSVVESPLAKRRKLDPSVIAAKSTDLRLSPWKEGDRDKQKEKDEKKDRDKQRPPLSGGVARVRSALDFLADQAEVYSTQPPSQASADSGGSPPKDPDDAPQDAGMENTEDSITVPQKGKDKASIPMSASRANTPVAGDERLRPPQADSCYNSRETTPTDAATQPSWLIGDSQNHPVSISTSTTLCAPLTLAPPIDLSPRKSRSPAPQGDLQNPRKRSISSTTEKQGSLVPSADSSFSMFSLQSTQQIPDEVTNIEVGQTEATSSRLIEGVKFAVDPPPRRTRSSYIKWTKEEDEQLAKAVAKHGQKWDLVQRALPSRGYHQVRQRWLRKLGVFESTRLDLASLETNAAAEFLNMSTTPPIGDDWGRQSSEAHLTPNTKLGLAPLNSERVLTASSISRSLSPFPTGGSSVRGLGSGFSFSGDVVNT